MGIKFWKFEGKNCPQFFGHGFLMPLKTLKIAYFMFWACKPNVKPRRMCIFHQNYNYLKPVRMVIEGLKFKKFAFGTFTRARDIILSKIVSSQNHVLLLKYVHLVYEMIKYVLDRCSFSLMFSDMIYIYEKLETKYLASSKFKLQ